MENNNCDENITNYFELEDLVSKAKEQPPLGSKELDTASNAEKNALKLAETSEKEYIKLVKGICNTAQGQLSSQQTDKLKIKKSLYRFISIFLIVQYSVLIFFMIFNGYTNVCDKNCMEFYISDDLLKTYIVSVFVETLAGLVAIIKFSFDSTQETEILKILSNIVGGYKKYKEDKKDDEDKNKR